MLLCHIVPSMLCCHHVPKWGPGHVELGIAYQSEGPGHADLGMTYQGGGAGHAIWALSRQYTQLKASAGMMYVSSVVVPAPRKELITPKNGKASAISITKHPAAVGTQHLGVLQQIALVICVCCMANTAKLLVLAAAKPQPTFQSSKH